MTLDVSMNYFVEELMLISFNGVPNYIRSTHELRPRDLFGSTAVPWECVKWTGMKPMVKCNVHGLFEPIRAQMEFHFVSQNP